MTLIETAAHLIIELFCVAVIVAVAVLLAGGPLFPSSDVEYVRQLPAPPADAVTEIPREATP